MSEKRAPNAARRNERSRQAILTAAIDLLTELGYAKLTIEAIAARAGVGKQTIYRWWPSKGAVILDAFLALNNRDSDEEVVLPDTGDIETDLKHVIRATIEELNDPRLSLPTRAISTELQHDPELAAQLRERVLVPALEGVKARLRSAQRVAQVSDRADTGIAVELLYGPIYYRWLFHLAPLTPEYADTIVELTLKALQPEAAA